LAGLGFALAMTGGAFADSITISSGVWAKFQQYKDQLKPADDEYFAASTTGGFSWESDKDKAISVLFAHNDQILVDYHVK
jgi:hypothetical protein